MMATKTHTANSHSNANWRLKVNPAAFPSPSLRVCTLYTMRDLFNRIFSETKFSPKFVRRAYSKVQRQSSRCRLESWRRDGQNGNNREFPNIYAIVDRFVSSFPSTALSFARIVAAAVQWSQTDGVYLTFDYYYRQPLALTSRCCCLPIIQGTQSNLYYINHRKFILL